MSPCCTRKSYHGLDTRYDPEIQFRYFDDDPSALVDMYMFRVRGS